MPALEEPSTLARVNRARQGISSAVNRLLESIRPSLRKRTRSRLPRSLDRKLDDSDIVQECLFLIAANLGDFKGQSPAEFRGWIYSILDRAILRQRRHLSREKRDRNREEPYAADGRGRTSRPVR